MLRCALLHLFCLLRIALEPRHALQARASQLGDLAALGVQVGGTHGFVLWHDHCIPIREDVSEYKYSGISMPAGRGFTQIDHNMVLKQVSANLVIVYARAHWCACVYIFPAYVHGCNGACTAWGHQG